MQKKRLLGPWRRSFQWFASLLILLLPWGHIGEVSLLRIDVPNLSLQLFGATLRIEELYLLLFFSLAMVLFFLLTTLVFGRIWCGWTCPQTTLSDISEWVALKLNLKISDFRLQGALWRKILLHLFFILVAVLVGSNMLWYFIEPQQYFAQIVSGQLHPVALGTLLIVAAAVYADLAFLRRLICRDFCPYGRFQTVLVDTATFTLQRPASEAPRCIECGACVRACPMEIDIRQGYQIECINCGRCLDACRKIMGKRQQPGLIGYHFGTSGEGPRAVINPRTILLTIGATGLLGLFVLSVQMRPEASLKIALSHQVGSRVTDGNQISFFNAWINNRSTEEAEYQLRAQNQQNGQSLTIKGPTSNIVLESGQNRKVDLVLVTPFDGKKSTIVFSLIDHAGRTMAETEALITPGQSR